MRIEIWGYHDGDSEDYCLLKCDVTWCGTTLPTFLRDVLPHSSKQKSILKMMVVYSSETSIMIYQILGVTCQKTIFKNYEGLHRDGPMPSFWQVTNRIRKEKPKETCIHTGTVPWVHGVSLRDQFNSLYKWRLPLVSFLEAEPHMVQQRPYT